MEKILMILEVSRKQNYIFEPRKLRDNMHRSANIAHVTSSRFFQEVCPEGYDADRNMVYSGGGHTVVQFDTKAEADYFARAVTTRVLQNYHGMELFVQQHPYDDHMTPGENLNELSRKLEKKKSRRDHAFRISAVGIEGPGDTSRSVTEPNDYTPPPGWKPIQLLDGQDDDDHFLAVVHIDGNAMGTRVQAIYDQCRNDWNACVRLLNQFSSEIDQHYAQAFDEMATDLAHALEPVYEKKHLPKLLPLRKIISAGDDVCFMTTGRLGLECAANFLKHLSGKKNNADGKYYTACAGVVFIHRKFPYREAYDMSEALCRSAKEFCAKYVRSGQDHPISALDFHVEYGQMKDTLSEIRADYRTDDGAQLELRPYAVTTNGRVPKERTYSSLLQKLDLLRRMQSIRNFADGGLARSKIKSLRNALHEGEVETRLALRMTNAGALLKEDGVKEAFFTDGDQIRRCYYFDAIELLDVTEFGQEVSL